MEFSIELDPATETTRVVVTTAEIDEDVLRLQAFVTGLDHDVPWRRIVGSNGARARLLPIGEIQRFFTGNKKVFAATAQGSWQTKYTMSQLAAALPARDFVRINQGEIVALSAVKSLDLSLAGTVGLTMIDGTRCFVSRRYLRSFRSALKL